MVAIGVAYLMFEDAVLDDASTDVAGKGASSPTRDPVSKALLGAQVGLVALSLWVTRSSVLSLQAKQGLPRGNQVVGMLVFFVSIFAMPLAHRSRPDNNNYQFRLMMVFLTFAPTFVILTISYEGIFYIAFSTILISWVRMEHAVYVHSAQAVKQQGGRDKTPATTVSDAVAKPTNGSTKSKAKPAAATAAPAAPAASPPSATDASPAYRPLTLSDARVALFFFVLLQSAFFSASNVASVSSFSLDSVQRLIPVFDPFSQGSLLTVKLLVPFALISANLGILNMRLGVAPSALFMVVMAMSDVLTLYFFWVVKDEGSWLEIGSTISHFVIASLLCAFVAGLEGVSALFVSGVDVAAAVPARAS